MGDSVESLAEVKVDNIHGSPLIKTVTSSEKAIRLVKLDFSLMNLC